MGSGKYINLAEAKGEAPITMKKHKTYSRQKMLTPGGQPGRGRGGRVDAAGID